MFDLGIQELIVIFVVALIVFGPKRLPELGRTLGKGLFELKKAMEGIKEQMSEETEGMQSPTNTLPAQEEKKDEGSMQPDSAYAPSQSPPDNKGQEPQGDASLDAGGQRVDHTTHTTEREKKEDTPNGR